MEGGARRDEPVRSDTAGDSRHRLPDSALYRPLFPQQADQGDPYVLEVPGGASSRFRYYTYVTGDDEEGDRAFPVYGSPDLVRWEALGSSLAREDRCWRWAPCVRYVAGLERPYVMLYSKARGRGDPDGHVEHKIRRADSLAPEGPFVDSEHVLTGEIGFAIDPDVYSDPGGTLWMAFATDFEQNEPIGTGLAEVPVNQELTERLGPVRVLGRARAEWQVYEARRSMPWKTIAGYDWERGDTVCWHCVEAPVGGLVSPLGRRAFLYSGGNFQRFYAIGALVEDAAGDWIDVGAEQGRFVLQPQPERGLFGPGHCSLVRGPEGATYVMFHARFGSPEAPRQMALAPLRWDADGFPYCPPPG